MTTYAVTWNMPGYLPEADPIFCEDFASAKSALIEELLRSADNAGTWVEEHDCGDDDECEVYGSHCGFRQGNELALAAEDVNLWSDEDSLYSAGMAWSITKVEVPCEWFALCENTAATFVYHPVLGDVPTCARCAEIAEG